MKELTTYQKTAVRRNWGGKILPIFPPLPGYATRCGRFNSTRSFIGCWGSTSGSTRRSALSSSAPNLPPTGQLYNRHFQCLKMSTLKKTTLAFYQTKNRLLNLFYITYKTRSNQQPTYLYNSLSFP